MTIPRSTLLLLTLALAGLRQDSAKEEALLVGDLARLAAHPAIAQLDGLIAAALAPIAEIESQAGANATLSRTWRPHYQKLRTVYYPKLGDALRKLSEIRPDTPRIRAYHQKLVGMVQQLESAYFDLLVAVRSNDEALWRDAGRGFARVAELRAEIERETAVLGAVVQKATERKVRPAPAPRPPEWTPIQELEAYVESPGETRALKLLGEVLGALEKIDATPGEKTLRGTYRPHYEALRGMFHPKLKEAVALARGLEPRSKLFKPFDRLNVEMVEHCLAAFEDLLIAIRSEDVKLFEAAQARMGEFMIARRRWEMTLEDLARQVAPNPRQASMDRLKQSLESAPDDLQSILDVIPTPEDMDASNVFYVGTISTGTPSGRLVRQLHRNMLMTIEEACADLDAAWDGQVEAHRALDASFEALVKAARARFGASAWLAEDEALLGRLMEMRIAETVLEAEIAALRRQIQEEKGPMSDSPVASSLRIALLARHAMARLLIEARAVQILAPLTERHHLPESGWNEAQREPLKAEIEAEAAAIDRVQVADFVHHSHLVRVIVGITGLKELHRESLALDIRDLEAQIREVASALDGAVTLPGRVEEASMAMEALMHYQVALQALKNAKAAADAAAPAWQGRSIILARGEAPGDGTAWCAAAGVCPEEAGRFDPLRAIYDGTTAFVGNSLKVTGIVIATPFRVARKGLGIGVAAAGHITKRVADRYYGWSEGLDEKARGEIWEKTGKENAAEIKSGEFGALQTRLALEEIDRWEVTGEAIGVGVTEGVHGQELDKKGWPHWVASQMGKAAVTTFTGVSKGVLTLANPHAKTGELWEASINIGFGLFTSPLGLVKGGWSGAQHLLQSASGNLGGFLSQGKKVLQWWMKKEAARDVLTSKVAWSETFKTLMAKMPEIKELGTLSSKFLSDVTKLTFKDKINSAMLKQALGKFTEAGAKLAKEGVQSGVAAFKKSLAEGMKFSDASRTFMDKAKEFAIDKLLGLPDEMVSNLLQDYVKLKVDGSSKEAPAEPYVSAQQVKELTEEKWNAMMEKIREAGRAAREAADEAAARLEELAGLIQQAEAAAASREEIEKVLAAYEQELARAAAEEEVAVKAAALAELIGAVAGAAIESQQKTKSSKSSGGSGHPAGCRCGKPGCAKR